jgi:pimeloyl-ACP methyl ester carboxylesterase
MRAIVLMASILIAACSQPSHRDVAAGTSFDLARTHGHYVTVNGLETFVIVMGDGPDVLLLHGDPLNIYSWRHVIEPLAERYRVHAIDLPGYGMSEKPADAPYNATWFAGHVEGYLRTAGVEHAVVIGNSMGGEIASEVAALYPRNVRGLVLIAAVGLPVDDEPDLPLAFRVASWPIVGRLASRLPLRSMIASALRDAYYDPALVTEQDVDAYYAPTRSRNGLTAFFERRSRGPDPDRTPIVQRIQAPTLIILGEVDRLVPLSVGERYRQTIEGSRLVVIEKAGHMPQEERPAEVLAVLDDWLRGLSP